jgi:uncharacterized protein (TIGR02147 family)
MPSMDPEFKESNAIEQTRSVHQKILSEDLEKRCEKNPSYSLRAFARDLNLSPSHLSGVLAGRYGLSREGASDIAKRLSLSKYETDLFIQSVESRHARSKAMREQATKQLARLQRRIKTQGRLQLDQFRVISDWFHFAILELTYLKNFRSDIHWIAKALNIHPEAATGAVNRLKRMKMLTTEKPRWAPVTEVTETGCEIPSAAVKSYHAQILEKAGQALHLQPIEKRDFRSTVLAIRKEKLAEAKKALEKLHQDFCMDISETSPGNMDDVYCLSTQLFSVTHLQETKQ